MNISALVNRIGSLNYFLHNAVQEYGDQTAFFNFGARLSYTELAHHSACFAHYLLDKLGLEPGDRVALMLPNCFQYPIALFGVLQAGLTVVNVNPLYTARELAYLLTHSEAKAIVILDHFTDVLAEAMQRGPVLKQVITTDLGAFFPPMKRRIMRWVLRYIKRAIPANPFEDSVCLRALIDATEPLPEALKRQITPEDIAFLQYTGGTTGAPKAAALSHGNMIANILQCREWLRDGFLTRADCALAALPFYHIFSLTVSCLAFLSFGVPSLLITNPKDISGFLKTLKKQPVTIFIGLNTLFQHVMSHRLFREVPWSRLRLTVSGGMATHPSVAERWFQKTGSKILEGYGLTECSPVVSINPLGTLQFNHSIGQPVIGTRVMLRLENGELSEAPDQPGELCVAGPQVMRGYWQDEVATAAAFFEAEDGERWLLTGDIARFDKRGFIYLIDRKKDVIIVSGFNVYPNEVEAYLTTHPQIEEAAVIGVPTAETGEAVKAFIVPKQPGLDTEAVRHYCRSGLAAYKVPTEIECAQVLPKTAIGKVLRRALRD